MAELAPENTVIGAYWGTSEYDQAYFVELDGNDQVYLFGQTLAPGSVLIGERAVQRAQQRAVPVEVRPRSRRPSPGAPGSGTATDSRTSRPPHSWSTTVTKICISGWGSAIQGGQLSTNGLPVTADAYQAPRTATISTWPCSTST